MILLIYVCKICCCFFVVNLHNQLNCKIKKYMAFHHLWRPEAMKPSPQTLIVTEKIGLVTKKHLPSVGGILGQP